MSYSYIASNKTIGTITEKIGEKIDKNERPDIVIYKKTAAFEKAVIIEFKKPETNIWDVGKSLEQCFLYAKQLSDSGIKEIHCYSIADINDDVRTIFEGRNFIKLFSTNETEIWQGSFGKINAYIQVITYATILNDAENRNQVFLDIIKRSKGLLDQ